MKVPTERMKKIPFAGIRDIFEKAKKLEEKGRKIIHMEIGRPDFDTPLQIKEKAIESLKNSFVHYTSNYGMDELRKQIARKLTKENNIETSYEEVIVTPGASMALATAIFGLLDEGDEVLIPSPRYPAYPKQVMMAGGVSVPVQKKIEYDFKLRRQDLEEKVTKKTKMLVINTPNNPTGAVLDYDNLTEIAEFAKENDIIVVTDECYEKIIYNREHISLASLPGMKERTVTINSTSKSFSMTGWRIGFVSASKEIINSIIKVPQNLVICPTSFAQAGAVIAYEKGEELIKEMVDDFKKRKEIVTGYLDQIEGIDYVEPAGALYVFPYIKELGMSSKEICDYLLKEAGVAVAAGNDFGEYGEGYIRIAYTCSKNELKEGMENIKEAVEKIN